MQEFLVWGDTLPEAYHTALFYLDSCGEIVECPDYNTRCKEVTMTMVVNRPLQEPMISRCIPCGAEALQEYVMEMVDGVKDFCVGKGWDYTYHDRMTYWVSGHQFVDQIEFVIDELKHDPNSRRAVIDVRHNAIDAYSDDPACLQHIQYFIRDNKLHCKVLFRSNDATRATFMNAFALIMLQKKIADELDVEVGTYTHRANSFHAYESNDGWELLESYAKRINTDKVSTYNYKGDWEEQMKEAIPEIEKKVKEMKERYDQWDCF